MLHLAMLNPIIAQMIATHQLQFQVLPAELSAQLQDLYLQILHQVQLIWTDQHQALTL